MKLIAFDHGYWTVEAGGKQYKVFCTLVEAGFLYELSGRWLPEDDPRVIAERTSLTDSPAYSSVNGGCVNPPLQVSGCMVFVSNTQRQ